MKNSKHLKFLGQEHNVQVKYKYIKCIGKDVYCSISVSVKNLDLPQKSNNRVLVE